MSEFRNRLLFPFGVTFGAAVVVVAVVFSLSRVLLALEQESSSTAATVVAMAGASAVLLGAVWSVARRRASSRPVLAVLLGAGVTLVAAGSVSHAVLGGGGEEAPEVAHGESAAGKASPIQVVAEDIAFDPVAITVPAGLIEITLTNRGAILHSLVIDGLPDFRKLETAEGATATGTLDARPGTYAYYCDQPGHRAAGMEGTLTVQ